MILHYFVEGENERKLIETIKNKYLYSGKIKIINTIQNKVPNSILRTLERETVVVLVFDTDVEKIDILDENIKLIKNSNNVKDVICIPQIKNLEDELIYSTNINKIVLVVTTFVEYPISPSVSFTKIGNAANTGAAD